MAVFSGFVDANTSTAATTSWVLPASDNAGAVVESAAGRMGVIMDLLVV